MSGIGEALGLPALKGRVLRHPRVGTVVAPLDIRNIEHAFQVRHLLEGPAAGLAAQNATPDDVAIITGAFDDEEAAIDAADFRAMLQMDRVFRRAITIAAKNPTLGPYVMALQTVATRFWIYDLQKQTPGDQLLDVDLHRRLGAAIAVKDKVAVEEAAAKLVAYPRSQPRSARLQRSSF